MTPQELVTIFQNGQLNLKGGTFFLFNKYHFGKPCDNFYKLVSVNYDAKEDKLILQTTHPTLSIWKPQGITETNQHRSIGLIIKSCEKLLLEYEHEKKHCFIEYIPQNNNVIVTSNADQFINTTDFKPIEQDMILFSDC